MASSKEYLDYILEQLSECENITYRAMMGEYIIYCKGKIIGGVYDDRFLVKPVNSAKKLMPDSVLEFAYEGGSKMLLVSETDDRELLKQLVNSMLDELPAPKKK